MKKISALFLAAVMMLTVPITGYATEGTEQTVPTFTVSAPTFPDAYIITETTYPTQNFDGTGGSLGSISATVFVEETYGVVDGELTVVESRLLSEEEVLEIGIDNFENHSETSAPRGASNSRSKLTITFAGTYSYVGNGVSCDLVGSADWATADLFDTGEDIPATGEDFIGVTWSGGFTSTDYAISGTDHQGGSLTIYESDSVANGGRVWSFADYVQTSFYNLIADHIDLDMTITKNTLEGNGNTAEAVLKYIHTYSEVEGSITIEPGSQTVSGSFTLSNTAKQWPLVCTVTDIPY